MRNLGGKKGGDVMKNKKRGTEREKRKTNKGMCWLQPGRSSAWVHIHLGRSTKDECLCPISRDSDITGLGAAQASGSSKTFLMIQLATKVENHHFVGLPLQALSRKLMGSL